MKRFLNRELSWLEFHSRVLALAQDSAYPLLERVNMLGIASDILDEFIMTRVAILWHKIQRGSNERDLSGATLSSQFSAVRRSVIKHIDEQHRILRGDIIGQLEQKGIRLILSDTLSQSDELAIGRIARKNVLPALTPLVFERSEALSFSGNPARMGFFLLQSPRHSSPIAAIVPIPTRIEQLINISGREKQISLTFLESVILRWSDELFPGYQIIERILVKLIRDSELTVGERQDMEFIDTMELALKQRAGANFISMIATQCSDVAQEYMKRHLPLDTEIFALQSNPLDLGQLKLIAKLRGYDNLRLPTSRPIWPVSIDYQRSPWAQIRQNEILLHHPYESFEPIIWLIDNAAEDEAVISIKITLYRTSGDSPILDSLIRAAERGKQVIALLELRARFNERRNIKWANRLKQAGAIVIYGIVSYKVHAKALIITRQERKSARRYVHIGTGNYNEKTALVYTDISYFSSDPIITYEVGLFFNALTGTSSLPMVQKIAMAPINARQLLLRKIRREEHRARSGERALIMIKCNAIADQATIAALYDASQAGVSILLNVRGICLLIPGEKGLSENIRVVSIVGMLLEHARIFYFLNGGEEEVYCGSADIMMRNFDHRAELLVPIEAPSLRRRLRTILETIFADNSCAYEMLSSGKYRAIRPTRGQKRINCQERFFQQVGKQTKRRPAGDRFIARRAP